MSSINPYDAPKSLLDEQPLEFEPTNQTLTSLLFSFKGRIPRRKFWGVVVSVFFSFGVLCSLLAPTLQRSSIVGPLVGATLMGVLFVVLLWTSLAIRIKRWHDRDKSGWWVLINLIPILGLIWTFVEVGCMRGIYGPNQYGPDPT